MTNNRTITVTGRGSIYVVPDVTRLMITVNSVFPTYAEAPAVRVPKGQSMHHRE